MSQIPEQTVTQETLTQWWNLSAQLKKIKASEITLRKMIFDNKFTEPKEGTNSVNIDEFYVLKGKHTLNRNVDVGAYKSIQAKLREMGVHDDVVDWKPELKKANYNKLTNDQRKFFDQCLIIKPGTPALEIVLPAEAKKRLDAAQAAPVQPTDAESEIKTMSFKEGE